MNLPNTITVVRFLLIPLYLVVFSFGNMAMAFGIVMLAGLSDILDGHIARKSGQVTQLGSMLDPLADKSMMIAVIVSLLYKALISWQAALLIFIRDVAMIVGSAIFHFRGKQTVPANVMGKLTTGLFYIAIMLIFFDFPNAEIVLWIAIILSFITSFVYVVLFRTLHRKRA